MLKFFSSRQFKRENLGLALRWVGVFLALWAVASVATNHPQTPMHPAPLFAATPEADPIALAGLDPSAPIAIPRIDDLDDSHTLQLAGLEKRNRQRGSLSFGLLRETKLNRRPPPVYTEDLQRLDGQQVSIFGFMTPFDSLISMKTFMVMPVSTGCQFCAPPSPLEVILVRQKDAKEHPFIDEPIAVRGKLNLWKEGSDDEMHTMFLYVIDDAEVLPASKVKDQ